MAHVLPVFGNGEESSAERVPLVRIIVDPGAYHGRTVYTRGFYSLDLERSALFVSEEAADFGMGKDAIWLDFGTMSVVPADFNRKHVGVIGTVDAKEHGSWGLFAGELDVSEIWEVKPASQSGE